MKTVYDEAVFLKEGNLTPFEQFPSACSGKCLNEQKMSFYHSVMRALTIAKSGRRIMAAGWRRTGTSHTKVKDQISVE